MSEYILGFCMCCKKLAQLVECDTDIDDVWCCGDCSNDLYAQREAAINGRGLVKVRYENGQIYLITE